MIHLYIYVFFIFPSVIGYYKILNIVPCAILEIFVDYLSFI